MAVASIFSYTAKEKQAVAEPVFTTEDYLIWEEPPNCPVCLFLNVHVIDSNLDVVGHSLCLSHPLLSISPGCIQSGVPTVRYRTMWEQLSASLGRGDVSQQFGVKQVRTIHCLRGQCECHDQCRVRRTGCDQCNHRGVHRSGNSGIFPCSLLRNVQLIVPSNCLL